LGSIQPDVWRGTGGGHFTTQTRRRASWRVRQPFDKPVAELADINGDTFPDLLIKNQFQTTRLTELQVTLYVTDVNVISVRADGVGMADYDNDGDLDWFVTAIWDPMGDRTGREQQPLYRNQTMDARGRHRARVCARLLGLGACFADFNNVAIRTSSAQTATVKVSARATRASTISGATILAPLITQGDGTLRNGRWRWGSTTGRPGRELPIRPRWRHRHLHRQQQPQTLPQRRRRPARRLPELPCARRPPNTEGTGTGS
jgi:hypothetical protein